VEALRFFELLAQRGEARSVLAPRRVHVSPSPVPSPTGNGTHAHRARRGWYGGYEVEVFRFRSYRTLRYD
jgi:hypothetical protein